MMMTQGHHRAQGAHDVPHAEQVCFLMARRDQVFVRVHGGNGSTGNIYTDDTLRWGGHMEPSGDEKIVLLCDDKTCFVKGLNYKCEM